ncbi:MAG TPA: extracellular solute-binding protein [Bacillota bacterium]|nr:extracellular solute-binding protein [Bacillota bacterium]
MSKKILCLLLLLILILPVISACKDDNGDNKKTTSTGAITEAEAAGLTPRNFGGKQINIVTVDEKRGYTYYNIEWASDKLDDDEDKILSAPINNAVYNRTQILRDEYGIDLNVIYTAKPSDDYKNEVMAGTSDIHIIADGVVYLAQWGLSNLLKDLNKIPNLDLTKSWWDQTAIKDLSMANYLFCITGDIIVSDKNATWACFFNKDMLYNNGLEDPYQLVRDGKWTVDKLHEMAKAINPNGAQLSDWQNDTYGFLTQTYDAIASMCSYNQRMIIKDENDYPLLNIDNEDTYKKFEKIFNLMTDKSCSIVTEVAIKNSQDLYRDMENIFLSGRALFEYNKVAYVQKIQEANTKFEFGILPMPKYDENQDKYYTTCTVYFSEFIGIPICVKDEDLDAIGYTLQLMGYYGEKYVRPAYYDVTLKLQKVNSEQDEEMLDIIFANRVYDLAAVFNYEGSLTMYTNIVMSGVNTLTSVVEKNSDRIQAYIDQTIESFKALDQ